MRAALTFTAMLTLAATIAAARPSAQSGPTPPADLIRAAVQQRLGSSAVVDVSNVQVLGAAAAFTSARLDPAATLGRPLRVSLVPASGQWITATAEVHVTIAHARARRAIARGELIGAADIEPVTAAVTNVPMRALPAAETLVGARLLRALRAGQIVQANFVLVRRAIEPGDRVTAIASIGEIEVTAAVVAADGGRPGDVIRVVNPDTKKYIRGRVVRPGVVEVIHER